MRVHIRGQMGVQILQSLVAIGKLHADEEPIIVVNTANLAYDATEKLSRVFEPKCEIRHQDEMRKTPYWEPGAATIAMEARARVLRDWLPLRDGIYHSSGATVMHCRGGDKQVATADAYEKLAKEVGAKIDLVVSNDATLGESVASRVGAEFNPSSTAVDDWSAIISAGTVIAAPSAFVMSAMVVDPSKHVIFAGKSLCDGSYAATDSDLAFIDEAMTYCPRVEVVR